MEHRRYLTAGEGQPPLAVRPPDQGRAAGQQVEARDGLLLRDLAIPEVVGRQPALGHGRPAPERHHGHQVIQHPTGARLGGGGQRGSQWMVLLKYYLAC